MNITTCIVERVAEKEGCEPKALPPLWDSIDAEAVEQCIDSTEAPIEVRFRYCWYSITVRADDGITITISDGEESEERVLSP